MHVDEPQVHRDPGKSQRRARARAKAPAPARARLRRLELALAQVERAAHSQSHRLTVSMLFPLGVRSARVPARMAEAKSPCSLSASPASQAPEPTSGSGRTSAASGTPASMARRTSIRRRAPSVNLAAGNVDLARAVLHLESSSGRRVSDAICRARVASSRAWVAVADEHERRRHVSGHPCQPREVTGLRGEIARRREVFHGARRARRRDRGIPEVQADVDPRSTRVGLVGKAREGDERPLEVPTASRSVARAMALAPASRR